MRSAGCTGSVAQRLIAQGSRALNVAGEPEDVMLQVMASALGATRLCNLDAAFLTAAGLSEPEIMQVLFGRFDVVREAVEAVLRALLHGRLFTLSALCRSDPHPASSPL